MNADPINRHDPETREKLRRAGLSQASELREGQMERLNNLPIAVAEGMSERQIRAVIYGEAVMKQNRKPTVFQRARETLKDKGAPMHYRDLAEALVKSGNVTPRGKTFAQTLSADLTRHIGRGVKRVAPGVYAYEEVDSDA